MAQRLGEQGLYFRPGRCQHSAAGLGRLCFAMVGCHWSSSYGQLCKLRGMIQAFPSPLPLFCAGSAKPSGHQVCKSQKTIPTMLNSPVSQECACFFAQELFQELFSVWLGHMFHGKNLMIVIMSKCGYGTLAHPRGLNGAGHARETVPAELGRRRTWRTRDASASTRCETCFGATRSVGGPALVLSRSSIHVKNALRLFRASMWHTRILYYYMILYVYCIHTCNICNILYIV